jgi:hypothetical protein
MLVIEREHVDMSDFDAWYFWLASAGLRLNRGEGRCAMPVVATSVRRSGSELRSLCSAILKNRGNR